MYQYGNIEETEVGDILECIKSSDDTTKGKLYTVYSNPSARNILEFIKDDGGVSEGLNISKYNLYWKLVLTKPGAEAKIGDTVISVAPCKSAERSIPKGGTFIVIDKMGDSCTVTIDQGEYTTDQFLTLCSVESTESCTAESKMRPSTALFSKYTNDPQTIPEEEIMNTHTITVTMTAKELAKYEKDNKVTKPKTDLEKAPKYQTQWYNASGETAGDTTTESHKQATKELQRPNRLGWTFRTYVFTNSRTTNIPTIDVK